MKVTPDFNAHIVIAAFDEASMIGDVVSGLRGAGYPVIVVDDGSADPTGAAAEKAGATVIRHPVNLGQGAALQTGLDFALRSGAETIVTFDADGQHRVADVEPLCRTLAEAHADFALGSRFLSGALCAPLSRRVLLKVATWFTRLTTGLRVTDTHNGLRAMTRRGAGSIKLRQNRMAHGSEILAQIAASGLKYVEVPVTIEYSAYSLAKGQSVGDAFSILVDLLAGKVQR